MKNVTRQGSLYKKSLARIQNYRYEIQLHANSIVFAHYCRNKLKLTNYDFKQQAQNLYKKIFDNHGRENKYVSTVDMFSFKYINFMQCYGEAYDFRS